MWVVGLFVGCGGCVLCCVVLVEDWLLDEVLMFVWKVVVWVFYLCYLGGMIVWIVYIVCF